MIRLTMSKMGRVEICPASTILPFCEEIREPALRGSSIHGYLANVAEIGPEDALAKVPAEYREECATIDLSRLPHASPDSWAVEVGMAWDWSEDRGRELFRGSGSRNYTGLSPTEIPGTADVLGLTESEVVVLDVKTGWARLGPPEDSPQLLGYAVAAARTYHRSRATVGWIRLVDETPRFETAKLDEFALDVAADRLRQIVDSAQEAERKDAENPASIVPVLGPHCKYCPAWRACPAVIGAARALSAETIPVLDSETAPKVWLRLEAAEKVLKDTREAIEEYAKSHPFDLPDGDRVGQVERKVEPIDALAAKGAISDELWNEATEIKYELTKKALKTALSKRLQPGQKITRVEESVLDTLRKAGALKLEKYYKVRRFRPKEEK